jgi:uncharacterized membrane protein YccC
MLAPPACAARPAAGAAPAAPSTVCASDATRWQEPSTHERQGASAPDEARPDPLAAGGGRRGTACAAAPARAAPQP